MLRTDEQRRKENEDRAMRRYFRSFYRNQLFDQNLSGQRPVRARRQKQKRRYRIRAHQGWRNVIKERQVDPALKAIIGVDRASWGDIIRLIWLYVKAHELQNPDNKRTFRIDDRLAAVVGNRRRHWIDGFSMMRYVKHHILSK